MQTATYCRRVGFSAFLFLVAAGGIRLLVTAAPANPPLLKRSTRITPLERDTYLWRSNSQVLLSYQQPGTQDVRHRDVVELDYRTGEMTPLPLVNNNMFTRFMWMEGSISPNGETLVIHRQKSLNEIPYWTCELNGSQMCASTPKISPPVNSKISNTLWFPDSRHWVFLGYDGRGFCVVRQGLDGSATMRGPSFGVPRAAACCADLIGSRLLGFVGENRLLALPALSFYISEQKSLLRLYEVSPRHSPDLKEYSLPLRQGERALDAALSPDGKRLALLVHSTQLPPISPLRRFLGQWWPSLIPRPQTTDRLYTVRPDGKEERTFGYLPAEARPDSQDPTYRLCWLPDGKRLSFIYHQTLWTVPTA